MVTAGELRTRLWQMRLESKLVEVQTTHAQLCSTMVWYNILRLHDNDEVTEVWKRGLPMFCEEHVRRGVFANRRNNTPQQLP